MQSTARASAGVIILPTRHLGEFDSDGAVFGEAAFID
jgi:hypothetical protein